MIGRNRANTNGIKGIVPIIKKEKNVTKAVFNGFFTLPGKIVLLILELIKSEFDFVDK